ncbi:hypothetical protein IW261DRAFT_1656924 [Armillaria novae-zelandiae]|uniref:Uncharacterized protein n=1 Tax=Armillaria novae-zelandiae TaxID=153914 RepID=A0AA39NYK4_9AGAR|nr:hypothetical protein IW261DRAFT_1656924 [Armillaria novae-zelandiae]
MPSWSCRIQSARAPSTAAVIPQKIITEHYIVAGAEADLVVRGHRNQTGTTNDVTYRYHGCGPGAESALHEDLTTYEMLRNPAVREKISALGPLAGRPLELPVVPETTTMNVDDIRGFEILLPKALEDIRLHPPAKSFGEDSRHTQTKKSGPWNRLSRLPVEGASGCHVLPPPLAAMCTSGHLRQERQNLWSEDIRRPVVDNEEYDITTAKGNHDPFSAAMQFLGYYVFWSDPQLRSA